MLYQSFCFVAAILAANPLSAQALRPDQVLERVTPGSTVRVWWRGHGVERGRVSVVADRTLRLETARAQLAIPAADVLMVQVRRTRAREGAISLGTIGGVTGLLIGAVVSVGYCEGINCTVNPAAMVAVGALFGGVGAITGGVVGTFFDKWEPVYP